MGELVAKGAIGDGDAVIDGGTGRQRLLAGLEFHIIQERRLGQITFEHVAGMMNTLPPANKVQQVISADAQSGVRQAADVLAVEVAIDPADLPAGGLLDDTNRTPGWVGSLLADDVELHIGAASKREWNCRASPPCTKKELGSWPGGRRTRRGVMLCARRQGAKACAACWPLPLASTSKVR